MEKIKIKGKTRLTVGEKVGDLDEAEIVKINILRNVKRKVE